MKIRAAFPSTSPIKLSISLAIFAALALTLSGCGIGPASAAGSGSDSVGPVTLGSAISGKLMGGSGPVGGAAVKLYLAGTTGYGSSGTLLATTTTSTDHTGSFSINPTSYTCPAGGQVYIEFLGGDPTGGSGASNTAIGEMAILGTCGSLPSYQIINEVTTAAALTAAGNYFNPNTLQFGTASSTQAITGLTNAFATAKSLAGYAGSSAPFTVSSTPASIAPGVNPVVAVTVTPESNKIDALADILSSCVQQSGPTAANCTDLFGAAQPPVNSYVTSGSSWITTPPSTVQTVSFPASTNTLQAMYYMAINPTSVGSTVYACANTASPAFNRDCLFGLIAGSGAPFATNVATKPTDWTVGISYSSSSICGGLSTSNFLGYIYAMQSDASGNIWGIGGQSASQTPSNALNEISPTGAALTCALQGTITNGRSLAIDINGHVWATGNLATNGIWEYFPATSAAINWTESVTPYVLTADGSGNIDYVKLSASGSPVYQFTNAANASSKFSSVQIGTFAAEPYYIAADTANRVWGTEVTGSSTYGLWESYPSSSVGNLNGYQTTNYLYSTYNPLYNPVGIAVGPSGQIYSPSSSSTTSNWLATTFLTSNTTISTSHTTAFAAGVNQPRTPVVDGSGNVWIENTTAAQNGTTSSTLGTGGYSISGFDKNGNILTPSTGSSTSTVYGGYAKSATVFPNPMRGMTIDPSGNIWAGLYFSGTSTPIASISELVGAATPTIAPLAAQLVTSSSGGTSANIFGLVGTKPLTPTSNVGASLPNDTETAGSSYTASFTLPVQTPTPTGTVSFTPLTSLSSNFTITNGGTGYTTAPTVTFTGGNGSGAAATATVTSGVVTGITLTNAGTGYTTPPTISFTGVGTGAAATATLSTTPGVPITSLALGSGGSGYTTATVAITGGGGYGATATATVTGGAVTGITLTNAGFGYTSAPTVTITGGTGATATATVNLPTCSATSSTTLVFATGSATNITCPNTGLAGGGLLYNLLLQYSGDTNYQPSTGLTTLTVN